MPKDYNNKTMSQPGSLVHSHKSSNDDSDGIDIKYIYRKAHNDTINEEDSAMFDSSQVDIARHNLAEEKQKQLNEALLSQAAPKLEELKSAYKQKRNDHRFK